MTDTLDAGDFSVWLAGIRRAHHHKGNNQVACGDCTACCCSSYFIHIGGSEHAALAAIPKALQFSAPRLPDGHMLMGYDEQGTCPMLHQARCSVYQDRPQTCRSYDCRIFTASGVQCDKPLVEARASRWRFSYPQDTDRLQQRAVQAAAQFMDEHRGLFPPGAIPANPTQLAVLATIAYPVFLNATKKRQPATVVGRVMVTIRNFKHEHARMN